MKITGKYVLPLNNVTQQYPENRDTLKMFDRFRGEVIMPHSENNEHLCTGCGIELNCPNGSIEIISKMELTEDGKKKGPSTSIFTIWGCAPSAIFVSKLVRRGPSWGRILNMPSGTVQNLPRS